MTKLKLLSTAAVALAIGLTLATAPVARAQTNSDQAAQDAKKKELEKKQDQEKLTPIRPLNNSQSPDKAKDQSAQSSSGKETTGAAASDDVKAAAQPGASAKAETKNLGTDASGRISLNATQQRQFSAAIRTANVSPTAVNVTVKVGGNAPRSVRLTPVTKEIVTVLPQFRGYRFFRTRTEIVIVEPSSYRIVATVPLHASAAVREPSHSNAPRSASTRRVIERDVTTGFDSPDPVVIERVPEMREEETIVPAVPGYSGRVDHDLVPTGRDVLIERR